MNFHLTDRPSKIILLLKCIGGSHIGQKFRFEATEVSLLLNISRSLKLNTHIIVRMIIFSRLEDRLDDYSKTRVSVSIKIKKFQQRMLKYIHL